MQYICVRVVHTFWGTFVKEVREHPPKNKVLKDDIHLFWLVESGFKQDLPNPEAIKEKVNQTHVDGF